MAWNPSSKVAAARDIGQKFKKDQVIIIMIDNKQDPAEAEYISYGKSKLLCKDAKILADLIFDKILGISE